MTRRTLCCIVALGLMLNGCITSLEPLVTEEAAVFDTDLIGAWEQTNGKSSWEFQSQDRGYRVIITTQEGERGEFHGLLTDLDGNRYLDLKPDLDSFESLDFLKWHLLPMHSFLRVDLTDDDMQLSLINIEWIKQDVESNPDAIAVREVDDRHVLAASTPELRQYVAANASEPEFFLDPIELERASQ